jgi:hypothetical protein
MIYLSKISKFTSARQRRCEQLITSDNRWYIYLSTSRLATLLLQKCENNKHFIKNA